MLRALDKFQGLLRMSVASAGNDHRLGANEAPPAIISIFLGDMLTDIFEQIEGGSAKSTKSGGILDSGVTVLPKLVRDAGDRNRTSPFAFTGNKFEFRAVSASQSIAFPNIALNVAVAEALDYVAIELERAVQEGQPLEEAVRALLKATVRQHKRIIFNGNNYSEEWHHEAARRGLLNHRTSVDAFDELIKPDVVAAFEKYKVLTGRELHARREINYEQYVKTINVEAQLMILMANRYILPAAFEYQTQVANSAAAIKAAGTSSKTTLRVVEDLVRLIDDFRGAVEKLAKLLEHEGDRSTDAHARHFRDHVVPAMGELREAGDRLESVVPHGLWPLPTYREMLFVK
jgi:glutamine synthetase